MGLIILLEGLEGKVNLLLVLVLMLMLLQSYGVGDIDGIKKVRGDVSKVKVREEAVITSRGGEFRDNRCRVVKEDLEKRPKKMLIGEYVLENKRAKGSQENAILAAEYLNGAIVYPGEVFSFNERVGNRTRERGFVDGGSIRMTEEGKKYVRDIGGGICRTSTALHLAIEDAGLEVVERNDHSLPVKYAPKGKDAAVAWKSLDYRFRNNTGKPIKLKVEATGGDVGKIHVKVVKILDERLLSS